MAEDNFKFDIPINLNGIDTSGKTEGSAKEVISQQEKMTAQLGKIAIGVGITALIWKGLEPLLTPLLKLLTLISMVLFLPLMPYVKQIAARLTETAKAVKDGQTGDSPGSQFVGGLGAFISDNYWVLAGGIIAGALITSLGSANIAGILFAGISLMFLWEKISNVSDIQGALENAGYGILAGALTALLLGAGAHSIKIGLLTGALTLGFSLLGLGLKEEDWRIAVLQGLGGSLLTGIVANQLIGAVLAALGIGAASLTVPITGIVFAIWAEWKWGYMEKLSDWITGQIDNVKEIPARLGTGQYSLIESIFGKKDKNDDIIMDLNLGIMGTRSEIERLQFQGQTSMPIIKNETKIVSDAIGNKSFSDSMIVSVMNTSDEFTNMANNTTIQTNNVIDNLNRIPRRIVTVHEIKTVRT